MFNVMILLGGGGGSLGGRILWRNRSVRGYILGGQMPPSLPLSYHEASHASSSVHLHHRDILSRLEPKKEAQPTLDWNSGT